MELGCASRGKVHNPRVKARFLGCEIKGVDPEPVEGKLQGITLTYSHLGVFVMSVWE